MTKIVLHTKINAPIATVFDCARSIDAHMESAVQTKEKAIAGVTSGLIGLGQTVTWKGKHFGFWIMHKSRITDFTAPEFFADEMERGRFRSFRHEHFFSQTDGITTMTDHLYYETPFGVFGKLFDRLLLRNHLRQFLLQRNAHLKKIAEA